MGQDKLDRIGHWSELKLEILEKYAQPYSTILSRKNLGFVYIDAFAGWGLHRPKKGLGKIEGSPLRALSVANKFDEYYFVELSEEKANYLKTLVGDLNNVNIIHGDCNEVLPKEIFPKVRWEDYRRGLCFLDPYGLHLDWSVVEKAGSMGSLEVLINFPTADIQRNVLRHDRSKVSQNNLDRMNRFWGDASWEAAAYRKEKGLFGELEKKEATDEVVQAYREQLEKRAGFKYAAEPLDMRNDQGAIVYHLFFATQNANGLKIMKEIFRNIKVKLATPWLNRK